MGGHDLSAPDALDRLAASARQALAAYGLSESSRLTLLNVSENATYRVDDPGRDSPLVLRVHRLGYHTRAEIESELAWLDALRAEAGIRTPYVLPTLTGARVVELAEGGPEPRHAALFEWLPGAEPHPDRLTTAFAELGRITAGMHAHSRAWRRPPGFTRFAWDYDGAFGAVARWGRWQDGVGLGIEERAVLDRLDATLRRRLAAYGSGPERYGLIHADLRLANLLVDGDDVYVIDFDDCGFGWFCYDFGTAVSFFEHDPKVPELAESWVRGYRTVLDLPAADEAELPTFVLMRRLLLVAWIGSHSGTELAQSMGVQYTLDSCTLAEDYLLRFG